MFPDGLNCPKNKCIKERPKGKKSHGTQQCHGGKKTISPIIRMFPRCFVCLWCLLRTVAIRVRVPFGKLFVCKQRFLANRYYFSNLLCIDWLCEPSYLVCVQSLNARICAKSNCLEHCTAAPRAEFGHLQHWLRHNVLCTSFGPWENSQSYR